MTPWWTWFDPLAWVSWKPVLCGWYPPGYWNPF